MERFSSFDGVAIAYSVSGFRDQGRAVLLLHGFASTSQINWVRPGLVDALVGAGRRVVVTDARGHGESDRPHEPAAYAGGAMARDVGALLDHLVIDEVDLAGYSMGSVVTLAVAANDKRVGSVFLGGAGMAQLGGSQDARRFAIAEALEADDPGSIKDASARAFRSFAEATGQDRLALAAIQRSAQAVSIEEASSVRVPATVVIGDRDTLVGDPESLGSLIVGSRTVVVPGDHISAVVKPEFRAALVEWATSANRGLR